MNVAVTGALGHMGRTVIGTAADRDDVDVAFGVDVEAGAVNGVEVHAAGELGERIAAGAADVVVDFSVPAATVEAVEAAAGAGVAAVVGTTGHDDAQLEAIRAASERVAVLKATNFSRGVHALLAGLEAVLEATPGYDVEVTETHHNRKRDAPSGTALTIVERIEAVRGDGDRVHGRVGEQPRGAGEIGVHARRAGDVHGEHEVLLAGNDEVLELTHRAESRRVFAAGALDAAVWLAGREPGWYDLADALGAGA